jgi:hypothetical protein
MAFCRQSIPMPSNNSPKDCKNRFANFFKPSSSKKITPTSVQVSPSLNTDPNQPTLSGGDLNTGTDGNLMVNKEMKGNEREDTIGNIDSER